MWNQKKKKKLNKNLNCSATSQHSGNIYRHLYVNISFSKRSTGKCCPARPSPHGHVFTSPVHQSDFNRGQNVVSWSNLKDHGGDSVELTLQHLTHTHTHKCNAASGLWELKPNINISQTIEKSQKLQHQSKHSREQRTENDRGVLRPTSEFHEWRSVTIQFWNWGQLTCECNYYEICIYNEIMEQYYCFI